MTLRDPLRLSTPRLTLIPFTADLLDLLLTDRAALETRLSARFLPRWDAKDQRDFLTGIRRSVAADPSSRVWHIYFILHDLDRVVIGNVGLKGPPGPDGSVEIHYGIDGAYTRQGYGYEAVRALVGWVFTQPEVRLVTAWCDWDNAASMRVLEKLGMRRVRVKGRLLWGLRAGMRALETVRMRRASTFLQRLVSRSLRVLDRLGLHVNSPTFVWHLPKERWVEHATRESGAVAATSNAAADEGRNAPGCRGPRT